MVTMKSSSELQMDIQELLEFTQIQIHRCHSTEFIVLTLRYLPDMIKAEIDLSLVS